MLIKNIYSSASLIEHLIVINVPESHAGAWTIVPSSSRRSFFVHIASNDNIIMSLKSKERREVDGEREHNTS